MEFSMEPAEYAGFPIVYVRGEMDLSVAAQLEAKCLELAAPTDGRIIVDLLDVSYAEAGPLGVLIRVDKDLGSRGGTLAVVCCDSHVKKLIEAARIDRDLAVFDDRDSAAAYLRLLDGLVAI